MLRAKIFAVAAAMFIAGAAGAQEKKADLTGKWTFTVQTDAGTGTPTVTIKQAGDSLSGHYSSQSFGELDFKGTVKDKTFTFALPVNVQGTTFTATYKGTIEAANALKGTLDLGGYGSGTFTATKQP